MLAHLTPLPPQRTGIADANARLLRELSTRTSVTAYTKGTADPLPGVDVRRAGRWNLSRLGRHEVVVAQMGNSAAHAWILSALERRPMTVELHDLVLHHLVAHMHFNPGGGGRYEDAMARDSGTLGRLVARGALAGEFPQPWEVAAERFPLTGEALRHADRVIVHSEFAARRVRERFPELDVHVVPLLTEHVATDCPERPGEARWPLVGCFGFVTREKRIDLVMSAVARARKDLPNIGLLIVGQAGAGIELAQMAAAARLPTDRLTVVDYADQDRFGRLMAGVDIGVNLRQPTMGETSATAVQLAGLGTPLIVSRGGWYDEIPDELTARIDHDDGEVAALAEAIATLASSRAKLAEMGEAAREWIDRDLSAPAIAQAHLKATLEETNRGGLRRALTAHVGSALADVSTAESRRSSGVPSHIAAAGRELGVL